MYTALQFSNLSIASSLPRMHEIQEACITQTELYDKIGHSVYLTLKVVAITNFACFYLRLESIHCAGACLPPCLKSILNLSKFWQKFDYMGLFLKLLKGKKNKKTQNSTSNF